MLHDANMLMDLDVLVMFLLQSVKFFVTLNCLQSIS